MMVFVALTYDDVQPETIWVNARKVTRIFTRTGGRGASISFGKGDYINVQEPPEEVLRRFQEGTPISNYGSSSPSLELSPQD